MTLQKHRTAAYLRALPFMPRTYFEVLDCRFCHMQAGNCQSHVIACPALYARSGRALLGVIDFAGC